MRSLVPKPIPNFSMLNGRATFTKPWNGPAWGWALTHTHTYINTILYTFPLLFSKQVIGYIEQW